MKALGASTNVEMDIFNVELNIDGIFLCSDGLTNMLRDNEIYNLLLNHPNNPVEALIENAKDLEAELIAEVMEHHHEHEHDENCTCGCHDHDHDH